MNDIYDVIIVGGGPAGLSAAIYLARAKFSVLVIEKEEFGGQITITSEIINYPGVLKLSGKELTENMKKQAQYFGAGFLKANVTHFNLELNIKELQTDKGVFKAMGVILATGSHPRIIGFPGEEKFRGHGVAYCATCDGEFFTGDDVFVVGGGYAACEEADFLTRYAKHITMIVREEDFTCAKQVSQKAIDNEKITVLFNSEIERIEGNNHICKVVVRHNDLQKLSTFECLENEKFGIFVFAGYEPETSLFKDMIALDENCYIITDKNQKTNVEGVYAAGDVCQKDLRQVVTAVSDGAVAATSLERYLSDKIKELHIKTKIPKPVQVKEIVKNDNESFLTAQMIEQLAPVINRINKKVIFKCYDNHSDLSQEMILFIKEFCTLSEYFSYEIEHNDEAAICLFDEYHHYQNICFHLVPGGHEFNSFVVGVYNVAGEKQPVEESLLNEIKKISHKNIKIIVSLSCTKCPELVIAMQRIAVENKAVHVEVYDLNHYPKLKDKYNVMSVPCMVIDENIYFGKKTIQELVNILKAD